MKEERLKIVKKGIEKKIHIGDFVIGMTFHFHGSEDLMYIVEQSTDWHNKEIIVEAVWVVDTIVCSRTCSMFLRLKEGDSVWKGAIVDSEGVEQSTIFISKHI